MKKWKRITAAALAAVMMLSLTACKKDGSKDADSTQTGQAETSAAVTEGSREETTAAGSEADAAQPAWKSNTDPVDLSWFVGASWYPYTWGDSLVSRNITEKTGVNVEIVTPTGDVNEELSLSLIHI